LHHIMTLCLIYSKHMSIYPTKEINIFQTYGHGWMMCSIYEFHFIFFSSLEITHPFLTKAFWKSMTIRHSIVILYCTIIGICSPILILFDHLVVNAFMLIETFGGIVGSPQHMKHDITLMPCFESMFQCWVLFSKRFEILNLQQSKNI
jgi:hypothetical protein